MTGLSSLAVAASAAGAGVLLAHFFGRNERTIMDWVRLHDEYDAGPAARHAAEHGANRCCGDAGG